MLHMRTALFSTSVLALLACPAAAWAQSASGVPQSSTGTAAGAPLASDAGSASAEADDGQQIGDIVVTAQRRSERLQSVPIAITAISGDALNAKGLTSTQDIAGATPGLTYTQVAGTAAPRIRGVGTVTALGGNENSVATYVDGVYYASSGSSILSLSNIAQVAVLKGPQGTLFGRNATGGLIQITTLDPKHELGGSVTASYGNLDTLGGTLYVTGGLSDNLAADLSVAYTDQQDGFGRNLTTGNPVNRSKNLTIRSKWVLDVGDLTTFKFSADYARLKAAGPARRQTYGSLGVAGNRFVGGPFDTRSNVDPSFDNEQGGASLYAVHHFDGVDLVSITAYRRALTVGIFDIDGTRSPIAKVEQHFPDRQFSQEIQLLSTGAGPFSYTLGAYYFRSSGGYLPAFVTTPVQFQNVSSRQRARAPAIYGQGTYKLGPATSLTLGLRYSWETRYLNASALLTTLPSGPIAPTTPIAGKLSTSRPTWRIALDHHITPDVLVYASYNRGFKSGGFNAGNFAAVESFLPEVLDAYEVGTKADFFGHRLRINASGFYYDYSNIQLTGFLGPTIRITNAASAKIYGLDLDVTARPVNGLTLTAGLSYIHDRFGTYKTAQISTVNAAGGNTLTSGSATGNRLPYTPDWTFNLGVDYSVPISSGELTLSAQYFHSDGWFAEPDNRLFQRPYDTLNGSIKWKLGDDKGFSVSVWGRNLTNEVYAATLQTQATSDVIVPANGRTYGATIGYAF